MMWQLASKPNYWNKNGNGGGKVSKWVFFFFFLSWMDAFGHDREAMI